MSLTYAEVAPDARRQEAEAKAKAIAIAMDSQAFSSNDPFLFILAFSHFF